MTGARSGPPRRLSVFIAGGLWLLAGCPAPPVDPPPPPPPPPAEDSCPFARDGACDEPANCALGTDSTDCAPACDAGEHRYLHAAACAHREPPPEEPPGPAGTGGSLHLTGYHDGVLRRAR